MPTTISTIAAYLRLLSAVALMLLQFPIRAALATVEWGVGEILARLVVLPYLFVLQVRRHLIEARLNAERQAQLARARDAALPTAADAAARLAHLEHVLGIIHDADRTYARQDSIHPHAAEATRVAFEMAMRLLHEVATDSDAQAHLGSRVAELFTTQKRTA